MLPGEWCVGKQAAPRGSEQLEIVLVRPARVFSVSASEVAIGYKEECRMHKPGMARWVGGQQRLEEKSEKARGGVERSICREEPEAQGHCLVLPLWVALPQDYFGETFRQRLL